MGRILDAKRDMDTIASFRAELEAVKASREGCIKDGCARQVESDRWKVEAREQMKRAEAAESELARLKDRVARWDIEMTTDSIARSLSAAKGGRYHGPTYNLAKAAAAAALKLAQAALTTDNPGGDAARKGGE